ncbi:MAG: monovalent cation/H(+) antiporter subunit G [Agarilytica sp.]
MILDVVSWACLVVGGFLCVTGAVGIFRFPDFFSRMHAASVTDSLGSGLIILGLVLQTSEWLVIAKLLFIMFFIFITSPTSSHALAKAALHSGLRPWKKPTTHLDSESS